MNLEQRHKRKREKTSRPQAVDDIARSVFFSGLFFLLLAGLFAFGLVAYYLARPSDLSTAGGFLGMSVVGLAVGIFLVVLARGFRALKPWTYWWVHELAFWARMPPFGIQLAKVERTEVRRAFGIDVEGFPNDKQDDQHNA